MRGRKIVGFCCLYLQLKPICDELEIFKEMAGLCETLPFQYAYDSFKDKALLFQCESSEDCELCIDFSCNPTY